MRWRSLTPCPHHWHPLCVDRVAPCGEADLWRWKCCRCQQEVVSKYKVIGPVAGDGYSLVQYQEAGAEK